MQQSSGFKLFPSRSDTNKLCGKFRWLLLTLIEIWPGQQKPEGQLIGIGQGVAMHSGYLYLHYISWPTLSPSKLAIIEFGVWHASDLSFFFFCDSTVCVFCDFFKGRFKSIINNLRNEHIAQTICLPWNIKLGQTKWRRRQKIAADIVLTVANPPPPQPPVPLDLAIPLVNLWRISFESLPWGKARSHQAMWVKSHGAWSASKSHRI